MASSERLDDLVARARTLFESKHGGSSEGCFAAYSPAKVVRKEIKTAVWDCYEVNSNSVIGFCVLQH